MDKLELITRICIAACLLRHASCCLSGTGTGDDTGVPGNAEELIMKHLGSEPAIPNVDEHGWTDDYIKEALELDCDFQDITTCKWKNLEENSDLDTTNFYLFEKTDPKRWPDLLRPDGGKGTPKVGEKFLLTGAQGSKEHKAVWHSAPIKCMKNPGVLQHQYWFYGPTKARVLLLDPETLKDKDFVDECQTVGDGVCKVVIPPQDEPFIIGIQAEKLQNSVYILDKIRFDADLGKECEGGLPDLGTKKEPFKSKAKGKPIDKDKDLNCPSFFDSCRWRQPTPEQRQRLRQLLRQKRAAKDDTKPEPEPEWQVHRKGEDIDEQLWIDIMGSEQTPEGAFLAVEGKEGVARLLSDPVECQINPGYLTFNSWVSQGTKMELCIVDMNTLEPVQDCTPLFPDDDPLREIEITSPEPEYLAIAVKCDMDVFEEKENVCFWSQNKEFGLQEDEWLWIEKPDKKKLKKATDTKKTPDGAAGLFKFKDSSGKKAEIISNRIECINGDARLKYKFWVSDGVVTEACLQYEATGEKVCQESEDTESPGPATFDFEEADLQEPFRLIISAHVHQPGFVLLDEVSFIGDVCEDDDDYKEGWETAPPEPEVDPCEALTVSFDENPEDLQWVEYDRWNEKHAPLIITEGTIGRHRHIELTDGESGRFAGVELTPQRWRTILESPRFSLLEKGDRFFSFFQHRSTRGSEVWLCKDEPPEFDSREYVTNTDMCTQLAGSDITLSEARFGERVGMVLPRDTERVYLLLSQPLVRTYGECTIIVDNFMLHSEPDPGTEPDCAPPFVR